MKLKTVQTTNCLTKNPTISCSKCKFNTPSKESLKIHIENVHEQSVYKCDQCELCFLSCHFLKIHKRLTHPTEKQPIVNKKSLNLTKGEAGGLSDSTSNPNRGQASKQCKATVSVKRDIKSIKPGSNYEFIKQTKMYKS